MQSVVFRDTRFPLGGNLLGGNAKGYVYVCSTCGVAWGKVEISQRGNYIISCWPCEEHGNAFNRGGSFLHRISWLDFSSERNLANALAACSDEFLSHEVMVLIKQRIGGMTNAKTLHSAAVEALEELRRIKAQNQSPFWFRVTKNLQDALENQQPAASGGPVAWIEGPHGALRMNLLWKLDPMPPQSVAWSIPLFTMPPKATSGTCNAKPAPAREPLTDAEVDYLAKSVTTTRPGKIAIEFARAIEAAHGILPQQLKDEK